MLKLNEEQAAAANDLFQQVWGVLQTPYDGSAGAAGRVLTLEGRAGSGKSEVLLHLTRELLQARGDQNRAAERQMRESREAADREARARREAEWVTRQAARPAPKPESDTDTETWAEPEREVRFTDDHEPWTPPKRKSKADMRAEARAQKEAEEFDAMDAFSVSFADEELEDECV